MTNFLSKLKFFHIIIAMLIIGNIVCYITNNRPLYPISNIAFIILIIVFYYKNKLD